MPWWIWLIVIVSAAIGVGLYALLAISDDPSEDIDFDDGGDHQDRWP